MNQSDFKEFRLVVFRNQAGSIEHYYHFLLAVLLPLANYMENVRHSHAEKGFLVRSCGPMDRMLRELNFPGLIILPKEEHVLISKASHIEGRPLYRDELYGLDFNKGDYPPAAIFHHAVDVLKRHLAPSIDKHTQRLSERFDPGAKRIILINRGSDPYFNSPQAEKQTSGHDRRSISNFEEVHKAVQTTNASSLAVFLEQTSLSEQIALFSLADIVIAQHGAALANIVFCKPGTRVIEIAPLGFRTKCFPPLSNILKLDHILVRQTEIHGACDISQLLTSVQEYIGVTK